MKNNSFFLSVALFLGTMIGAGIFGIPYVVSKSGTFPALFYFLILGVASLLIHLFLGEIILRTKGKHRLPGYAQKYLGRWGKVLAAFSVVLGIILALLAYIILGGNFLNILFSSFSGLSSFHFSLIFSLVLFPFIVRRAKFVAEAEVLTNIVFILIIFSIFFLSLEKLNLGNFSLLADELAWENIFLPYGVILFALIGWSAIPEMVEVLEKKEDKKQLKKAIIFSIIIAIFIYLLFVFSVVGVSGKNTSPETFSGLLSYLDPQIVLLGVLAGVITIADSFLVLSLHLRNTLTYDYGFHMVPALFMSWGVPLILFLLGFRQFIDVIGIAGTFIGAVEVILIILIFKKAKILGNREPEYSLKIPSFITHALIIMFILGAISQFFLK